uniref:PKD/REJ-like domain-containing protein n=1 Tax=Cryptomonas curvata TaxID=233186 RepID=A0A7S0MQV6_9CRYP
MAEIRFITPIVNDYLKGTQMLTITGFIGNVQRQVMVPFRYLPNIFGPPELLKLSPRNFFKGSKFAARLTLQNLPALIRSVTGYDSSSISIRVQDSDGRIRASYIRVEQSGDDFTRVIVHSSVCNTTGEWKIFVGSTASDDVAVFKIFVLETPAPDVLSWFPQEGLAGEIQTLTFKILYLPSLSLSANGNFSASVSSIDGKNQALKIIDKFSPPLMCESIDCSVWTLKILMPSASESINLESMDVSINLLLEWYDFGLNLPSHFRTSVIYRYKDPNIPSVLSWFPQSQNVGQSKLITVKLNRVACIGIQIMFQFDPSHSVGIVPERCSLVQSNASVVQFWAPEFNNIGVIPVNIFNQVSKTFSLTTNFAYSSAELELIPRDGAVSGGYLVSIYVKGWPVVESSDSLNVTFTDPSSGNVQSAVVVNIDSKLYDDKHSEFRVVVQVPTAWDSSGYTAHVTVQSAGGVYKSIGTFEYFVSPLLLSIFPQRANTNGETALGKLIRVKLGGAPNQVSVAEIEISFSSNQNLHVCDGLSCGVVDIKNALDEDGSTELTLSIRVPKMPKGRYQLGIGFLGTYLSQNRSVYTSFDYFVSSPRVQAVRWCQSCPLCNNSVCPLCIQNDVCAIDNSVPLFSQAGFSSNVCINGNDACRGSLTVDITNFPTLQSDLLTEVLDKSMSITAAFGNMRAMVRQIANPGQNDLQIEIEPPRMFSFSNLVLNLTISSALPSSTFTFLFPVTFFDQTVRIWCSSGPCQGPALDHRPFVAHISNLTVIDGLSFSSQVLIRFDGVITTAQMRSTNRSITVVEIQPISASSVSGSKLVLIEVLLPDFKVVASTLYTLWETPRVTTARFSSFGGSIEISFDADTNRAGYSIGSMMSCSNVLNNVSLLGSDSNCIWLGNNLLTLFLGINPSIIPGSTVQVLNLRSLNNLSIVSSPLIDVMLPEFANSPTIYVDSPQIIDDCSSLTLSAISSSPRPLKYSWSCENDEILDMYLSQFTEAVVEFSKETPELRFSDKLYNFVVQGTDFLGLASKEIRFSVLKRGSPVPTILFSPAALTTFRNDFVIVKAKVAFTQCAVPKSQMSFRWRQISGPSEIPSQYLGNTTQLYIPRYVLLADSTYIVAVSAVLESDPSVQSESTFSIVVGSLPLRADILGGEMEISLFRNLSLDASLSQDLDLKADADQGLTFTWSCSISNGPVMSACMTKENKFLSLPKTAKFNVKNMMLATKGKIPYVFNVTVCKVGKICAVTSASIFVREYFIPQVKILPQRREKMQGGIFYFNNYDSVALYSTCDSNETALYQWEFYPPLEAKLIHDKLLFPLGLQSKNLVMDGSSGTHLPLSEYTVMFSCTTSLSSSKGTLIISKDFPPSGGSCVACRLGSGSSCAKSGIAISDTFRLQCSGWSDLHQPLKYKFGIQKVGENVTTYFSFSPVSHVDLLLPNGVFFLKAIVQDASGAKSLEVADMVTAHSNAGIRKRLLLEDLAYPSPIESQLALLNEWVLAGNVDKVDLAVVALAMELNSNVLGIESSIIVHQKSILLDSLVRVSEFASVTDEFACESVGATELVTRQCLDSSSLDLVNMSLAVSHIERLIGPSSSVEINHLCAQQGLSIISVALGANQVLDYAGPNSVLSSNLINIGILCLQSILKKTADKLVTGQRSIFTSQFSYAEVRRMEAQDIQELQLCASTGVNEFCFSLGQLAASSQQTESNLMLYSFAKSLTAAPSEKYSSPIIAVKVTDSDGIDLPFNSDSVASLLTNTDSRLSCIAWRNKTVWSGLGLSTVQVPGTVDCTFQNAELLAWQITFQAETSSQQHLPENSISPGSSYTTSSQSLKYTDSLSTLASSFSRLVTTSSNVLMVKSEIVPSTISAETTFVGSSSRFSTILPGTSAGSFATSGESFATSGDAFAKTAPAIFIANQTIPIYDTAKGSSLAPESSAAVNLTSKTVLKYPYPQQTASSEEFSSPNSNTSTVVVSKTAESSTTSLENVEENMFPSTNLTSRSVQPTSISCDILPGLEALGCVDVDIGPVNLGVPSYDADSSFQLPSPYQSIQIFVSAGTWITAEAKASSSELRVWVFIPAISVRVPGARGGPAVYIQPFGGNLSKPIELLLPCNETLQNATNVASVFAFDSVSGSWMQAPAQNVLYSKGVIRVQIKALSAYVTSWILSADPEKTASKATAVIYGSVIGSAFVVFLTSLAVLFRYRNQLKAFKPVEQGPVLIGDAAELVYNIRAELRKNSVAGLELQDAEWSGPDIQTLDNAAVASDLIYKIGKELRRRSAVKHTPRQISGPTADFEGRLENFHRSTEAASDESNGDLVFPPKDPRTDRSTEQISSPSAGSHDAESESGSSNI